MFSHHGDVVAIEQDLVQFGYPPSLWSDFTIKGCYDRQVNLHVNI